VQEFRDSYLPDRLHLALLHPGQDPLQPPSVAGILLLGQDALEDGRLGGFQGLQGEDQDGQERVADSVSGDIDLVLQLEAERLEDLNRVRAEVAKLPGVGSTQTLLEMSPRFDRR
jgi:hypothetical protein